MVTIPAVCRHNDKDYNLKYVEYTAEENFAREFNEKGYVFLENVVNLSYDYKARSDYSPLKDKLDIIENFFPDTSEYIKIKDEFKNSKIFNIINNNFKNIKLYNFICFRLYKNAPCSRMHRDDDLAIIYPLKTPFFTCWMPLLNVTIKSGPLAVVKKTQTNYSNLDIEEGTKYINTYLKDDTVMGNIDGIRTALNMGLDYQKKNQSNDFDTLVARNLKKGDAVIMNHDVLHGSLDQNLNFVRSSVDLRVFYNSNSNNKLLSKVSLDF